MQSAKFSLESASSLTQPPNTDLTLETQPSSLPLDVSRQVVPLLCLMMHRYGYYCHGDEQSDPLIGKIGTVGGRV